jgi:hypothetical protein
VKAFDAMLKREHYASVVCADCRFRNEFNYLRKEGFFLIKLLRNTASTSTHSTETSQDEIQLSEFDAVVDNNGTIEQLRNQLTELKPRIVAKCTAK